MGKLQLKVLWIFCFMSAVAVLQNKLHNVGGIVLQTFVDILHKVGGGSRRCGQIATAANSGLASSRNVIMRACTYIKCALAHILNVSLHIY